ncbi:MAG: putative glycolipid-binding domain-containing protein [Ilumatobacteraceae bacterium]
MASEHDVPLRAFPADGYDTAWTTWDGLHREEVSIRWENEAWTVTGRVGREQVEYVLRLSPLWHVRQFLLFRDLDEPDLWLGTDGNGRWGEMNGAHRPELDGSLDLELAVTPLTWSLPIRRLPLRVGDTIDVRALTVDVDTLAVAPAVRSYRRTGDRPWSIDGADLTVDEFGLVTDVNGRFRRN